MININSKIITGTILVFGFIGTIAIVIHLIELLKTWNVESKDIVVGLMGIVGSLIGGILTVWGVALTIRATDKSKENDELPKKVLHIENTLDILNDVRDRLVKHSTFSGYSFVHVKKFDVVFFDRFTRLISEDIREMRNELVYVDSITYKRLLKLSGKLKKIQEPIIELQLLMGSLSDSVYKREGVHLSNPYMEDHEQERFEEILGKAKEFDDLLKRELQDLYRDFSLFVTKKHDEMLKRFDN